MVDNYRGQYDPPSTIISQPLTVSGTADASWSAIGAYSASAGATGEFYIQCPAGQKYALTRMLVEYSDAGMSAQGYGGGSALANGITVVVEDTDGSTMLDLTPTNIFDNTDWGRYCYDVDVKSWGTGDDVLLARWTFEKTGRDIVLTSGQRLTLKITDDMTHLSSHGFIVQGHRLK